jgi:hypothetical protein
MVESRAHQRLLVRRPQRKIGRQGLLVKKTAIIAAHALVGWALCGATMALALAFTSESGALVLHAIAAPVFFAIISSVLS